MIRVRVPVTCGELVQGVIGDDSFHVTCPLTLQTTVSFTPGPGGVEIVPADRWKSVRAINQLMRRIGTEVRGRIEIRPGAAVAKGMGSSTAELTGVLAVAARSVGRILSPDELADLALEVEPTDGLMFPGICCFDHRRGRIRQPLGPAPDLKLVVVEPDETLDTIEFNQRDLDPHFRRHGQTIAACFELVKQGLRTSDPEAIGRGATGSARCNQEVVFKPLLDAAIGAAARFGGYGVCVAHSGTVLGLLFPGDWARFDELAAYVADSFDPVPALQLTAMGSGGVVYED